MSGSMNALAQWFEIPADASAAEEDFIREDILSDAGKFTQWGKEGDYVIIRTPKGRILFEIDKPKRLVWVDSVENGRSNRIRFWMNYSSLTPLFDTIAHMPERQAEFEQVFLNQECDFECDFPATYDGCKECPKS